MADPTKSVIFNMFKGFKFNFSLNRVLLFKEFFKNKDFYNALYAIDYTGPLDDSQLLQELLIDLNKLLSSERYELPLAYQPDYIKKYHAGIFTEEDIEAIAKAEIKFDPLDDFDLLYALFLEKYDIDLWDQDINYFKFKMLLESILLEENSLTKRIQLRSFESKKGMDEGSNLAGMRSKMKYSINE